MLPESFCCAKSKSEPVSAPAAVGRVPLGPPAGLNQRKLHALCATGPAAGHRAAQRKRGVGAQALRCPAA